MHGEVKNEAAEFYSQQGCVPENDAGAITSILVTNHEARKRGWCSVTLTDYSSSVVRLGYDRNE